MIIYLLHRALEPPLDQGQDLAVTDVPGYRLHQFPVGNGVEETGQVSVHHLVVALTETGVHFFEAARPALKRGVALTQLPPVFAGGKTMRMHLEAPGRTDRTSIQINL
jgi:hypothetical protein